MADRDPAELLRENAYLKRRNAQLQSDILDVSAEVERLRGIQDRLHVRASSRKPDIPDGGELRPSRENLGQEVADVTSIRSSVGDVPEDTVIEDQLMAMHGITKVPSDYFLVGGYRYTSLREAVAQAIRQRAVA